MIGSSFRAREGDLEEKKSKGVAESSWTGEEYLVFICVPEKKS